MSEKLCVGRKAQEVLWRREWPVSDASSWAARMRAFSKSARPEGRGAGAGPLEKRVRSSSSRPAPCACARPRA